VAEQQGNSIVRAMRVINAKTLPVQTAQEHRSQYVLMAVMRMAQAMQHIVDAQATALLVNSTV
jgi:hypothetical protein